MSPITVVMGIQASTVTRVAFGELRRLASLITQIAMKSQIAIEMSGTTSPPAQIAATAPPLSSGVGLTSWANSAEAVKNNGEQNKSRFMGPLIWVFAKGCQRNFPKFPSFLQSYVSGAK